jgi:hypothetical protein
MCWASPNAGNRYGRAQEIPMLEFSYTEPVSRLLKIARYATILSVNVFQLVAPAQRPGAASARIPAFGAWL